jgi:hypothetical protein
MYKSMQRRIIHRQKEPNLYWNLETIKIKGKVEPLREKPA